MINCTNEVSKHMIAPSIAAAMAHLNTARIVNDLSNNRNTRNSAEKNTKKSNALFVLIRPTLLFCHFHDHSAVFICGYWQMGKEILKNHTLSINRQAYRKITATVTLH